VLAIPDVGEPASFPVDLGLERGVPGQVVDAEERRAGVCHFQGFGQSLIDFSARSVTTPTISATRATALAFISVTPCTRS
jgi:hypothetical protein